MQVGGRSWYPLMFQTAEINPYSGEIAASHLLSDRNKLEFVTESMRPLHTGDFGGIWIKLIWAFFGLLLSMMVLSGLLIWSKRTALATLNALKRESRTSPATFTPASTPTPPARHWRPAPRRTACEQGRCCTTCIVAESFLAQMAFPHQRAAGADSAGLHAQVLLRQRAGSRRSGPWPTRRRRDSGRPVEPASGRRP